MDVRATGLKWYLTKRDISPVTASTRAGMRGESPSGFNSSPAQPCACLPVTAAREGAEPRHFLLRKKVPFKAGCTYVCAWPPIALQQCVCAYDCACACVTVCMCLSSRAPGHSMCVCVSKFLYGLVSGACVLPANVSMCALLGVPCCCVLTSN
jgi:hypothetical protein